MVQLMTGLGGVLQFYRLLLSLAPLVQEKKMVALCMFSIFSFFDKKICPYGCINLINIYYMLIITMLAFI